MTINVHIERLVVDRALIEGRRAEAVAAALQRQLRDLVTAHGFEADSPSGDVVPWANPQTMRLPTDASLTRFGRQIAGAVYRGIGGDRGRSR